MVAAMLIGFLAAAIPIGKAFMTMPGKLDDHARATTAQTVILRRALCINIADHRKVDWTLCYTNPDIVMPRDHFDWRRSGV